MNFQYFDDIKKSFFKINGKQTSYVLTINYYSEFSNDVIFEGYIVMKDKLDDNDIGKNIEFSFSRNEKECVVDYILYSFEYCGTYGSEEENKYFISLKTYICFLKYYGSSRVFSDKSLEDIISAVCQESKINCEIDIIDKEKKYILQYNENNLEFINRICNLSKIYYLYNPIKKTILFSNKNVYLDEISNLELNNKNVVYTLDNKKVQYHGKQLGKVVCDVVEQSNNLNNCIGDINYFRDFHNMQKQTLDNIAKIHIKSIDNVFSTYANAFLCAGEMSDKHVIINSKYVYHYKHLNQIQHVSYISSNNYMKFPKYTPHGMVVINCIVEEETNDQQVDKNLLIKVRPIFCNDKKSFLLARLTNIIAGNKYGFLAIPRGQQEVYVCFLDNLLSNCIYLSCVYNEKNINPFDVKDNFGLIKPMVKNAGSDEKEDFISSILLSDKLFYMSAEQDMDLNVKGKYTSLVKDESNYTYEKKNTQTYKDECEVTYEAIVKETLQKGKETNLQDEYSINSNKKITIETTDVLEIKCKEFKLNALSKANITSPTYENKSNTISLDGQSLTVKTSKLDISAQMADIKSNMVTMEAALHSLKGELSIINVKLNSMKSDGPLVIQAAVVNIS
ncbi:hypothetical protein AB837_00023 [bacterium AB1]|nr:hypothetical protein AB837_00023 [bacterium AB1]